MNGTLGFANFWSDAALDTCRMHLQNLSFMTATLSGRPQVDEVAPERIRRVRSGQFVDGSFSNKAGSRNYKLYVPAGYDGAPLPLIVMLHGCAQDANDFAAGTQMNAVAEKKRCFVVYPEQPSSASMNKCWSWFSEQECTTDQGEASLIAGIVQKVRSMYRIDPRRIFIAGMSAGGAMAAAMVNAYPGMFAAIGVHSGLPFGVATDISSALSAMSGGAAANGIPETINLPRLPAIVFHGERDNTVHVRNGEHLVAQLAATSKSVAIRRKTILANHDARCGAYTRSLHIDAHDRVLAEHWLLHDVSHAWSGGSSRGSYTDTSGPNASEEMLRFFLQVA